MSRRADGGPTIPRQPLCRFDFKADKAAPHRGEACRPAAGANSSIRTAIALGTIQVQSILSISSSRKYSGACGPGIFQPDNGGNDI